MQEISGNEITINVTAINRINLMMKVYGIHVYWNGHEWCSGVRLAGNQMNNTGRLEISYSGVWGTVCDDSFDDIDAVVVCNTLGFGLVYSLHGFV